MRAAIAGKSPEEIVSLQSRGAPAAPTPNPLPLPLPLTPSSNTLGELDGEITEADLLQAVESTPPLIAPDSLRRYEARVRARGRG